MSVIRFGTDGWRGLIAQDFTFDNVAVCAQGLSDYLHEENLSHMGMIVGYDTRFGSKEFAECVSEILIGNGISVYLSNKSCPTPVLSYNIPIRQTAGAVIITASHNPALWNGFKYRSSNGGSATEEITLRLEKAIAKTQDNGMPRLKTKKPGRLIEIDPSDPYMEHIVSLVDLKSIRESNLGVIVDSMHGAASGYISSLIGDRCVLEVRSECNPAFPGMARPEPIGDNLTQLSRLIAEYQASIGIAFDGDGDRVGIVDENGQFVTTVTTFALLSYYMLSVCAKRGPLVKSITSSSMIDKLGEIYGVPVYETPVGFKHICPIMMREDALIGGEESGGYAFRGHIPERDGIFSGLMMLEYMAKVGKCTSHLVETLFDLVGPHYYGRRDITFYPGDRQKITERLNNKPRELAGMDVISIDLIDGTRFVLSHGSWLLIRFSDTEPLLRLYAEADSQDKVDSLLESAIFFLNL